MNLLFAGTHRRWKNALFPKQEEEKKFRLFFIIIFFFLFEGIINLNFYTVI